MLPTGLSQLAADVEVESGLGDEGDDDWAFEDQELDAADREQKLLQVPTCCSGTADVAAKAAKRLGSS